jgi:hypothetical protein
VSLSFQGPRYSNNPCPVTLLRILSFNGAKFLDLAVHSRAFGMLLHLIIQHPFAREKAAHSLQDIGN